MVVAWEHQVPSPLQYQMVLSRKTSFKAKCTCGRCEQEKKDSSSLHILLPLRLLGKCLLSIDLLVIEGASVVAVFPLAVSNYNRTAMKI